MAKIGAKVVCHGRYITCQLPKVTVSRVLFANILRLISGLRPRPAPARLDAWSNGNTHQRKECVWPNGKTMESGSSDVEGLESRPFWPVRPPDLLFPRREVTRLSRQLRQPGIAD